MKKITLTFLLGAICLYAKSQGSISYEFSGQPYRYEGVVKTDSLLTKDQLYSKAIEWFALTFKDSKSVLQVQDKSDQLIIGKAAFGYSLPSRLKYVPDLTNYVYFTIRLNFKDGRFKYELFDFTTPGYDLIKDGTITKYPDIKLSPSMADKVHKMALDNLMLLQNQVKLYAESIEHKIRTDLVRVDIANNNW